MIRRSPLALVLITSLLALPVVARAETNTSDARAVAIADKVLAALGGKERWDRLRGLRWTFGAQIGDSVRGNPRRHAWDKWTGWHRVQGRQRDGRDYLIVHNLNDGHGMAWVGGTPIEGDSLTKLIARAKSLWINDSYWFLMPYKLRDPGVTLRYAGDTTVAGRAFDRIALSFESVGETPGDHYWVYVNRANHRVEDWEMVLQGDEPPPRHYTWEGWEEHGGLWFPTAHRDTIFAPLATAPHGATAPAARGSGVVAADSRINVFTRDVETVSEFPAREFAGP